MKKFITTLLMLSVGIFSSFGQAELYNLESQNLHKKVRKTTEHFYNYDEESGGFVKTSVNIKRYNHDGNLAETYYLYDGKYSVPKPTKTLYNYNLKRQLISTKDISDEIGTYSSHLLFSYDANGNLIKKETIFQSGGTSYTVYVNDKKGKEISSKSYDKNNILTSESTTNYDGKSKTVNLTTFNTKDGSIIGTYKTIYENDIKTNYESNSKYSENKTTYSYDKYGNITKSVDVGKTNTYSSTYEYEYDKKNNWVKKHYRSGKYQYFYFREILFDDGEITGNTEFDKQFVNKFGTFPNVNVVPIIKKELNYNKNNNTNNTNINTNNVNSSGMPTIGNSNWIYSFVNMKGTISDVSGKVFMTVSEKPKLETGAIAKFTVEISGTDTKYLEYNVNNYYYDEPNNRHLWLMKTTNNVSDGTLCIFQTPMVSRGKTIKGILIMGAADNLITFYLQ